MNLSKIVIAAAATFSVMSGSVLAQEVTLRLHQFLPAQAGVVASVVIPWAERIEEQSNGRIAVEVFSSMQLGGAPSQLFDQARDGVVDIAWTVLSYTPGRFPKTEVFELPFVSASSEASSRAFMRFVDENAMDEFKDVHLITAHVHGPGLLHANRPIARAEDLMGMKIRGGSRVVSEMLAALGAEPIGMPIPGVPEALSKGVIDGTTLPWEIVPSLHLEELVHNHTEFEGNKALFTLPFAMVMNKDRYESLPDDLKAVIDRNSGIELASEFGAYLDAGDQRGRDITAATGKNHIVMISGEELKPFEAAADQINAVWISQTEGGQALFDAATALIAEETEKMSAN